MVDNANIFFSKLSYAPAYVGTIAGKANNGWGSIGKYYRPTNTGNWRLEKLADGDEFQIWGWNNVIINTGNVGIGTTSPTLSGTGKLHMAADTMRLDTARTPASADAAGNKGEICWDANYVYVAVDTNSWKRAAIAAW